MDKINDLLNRVHTSFINGRQKTVVSEYCSDNQFLLDDCYAAKLKKLNKKKRLSDDSVVTQFAIRLCDRPLPYDTSIGINGSESGYNRFLKTRLTASALKKETVNRASMLSVNKAKRTETVTLSGRDNLSTQPLIHSDSQIGSLSTPQDKQSVYSSEPSNPSGATTHYRSSNNEKKHDEVNKQCLLTVPIQQNSALSFALPRYQAKTNRASVYHNDLTHNNHQHDVPQASVLSSGNAMIYRFNKWAGNHSVTVQFQESDVNIQLTPSSLMVEQQLASHLDQLPTKFKVYLDQNYEQLSRQQRDSDLDSEKEPE